jgi:asparagine synthase (glutamine-hydrolysing)
MSELGSGPVKTFSIGYEGDDGGASELPYARMVAERYGTEHHEVMVDPSDLVHSFEDLAWHLDQPIADEACLPSLLLSRSARPHVKAVLTGEGGDELFAGYARYRGEQFRPAVRALPLSVSRLADQAVRSLPGRRRLKLAVHALVEPDEGRRFVRWFPLLRDDIVGQLLAEPTEAATAAEATAALYREHLANCDATDGLSRMLYLDTKLWLPDDLLARGDKTSMAASLEARVPLLDHHLVEFAASVPPHLKLRGRRRKYLLKKVASEWLPPEILDRRKQGFPTPVSLWLRGGARTFCRDLLATETIERRGLFEASAIRRLLDDHDSGAADHGSALFALIGLELWHRAFIDRTPSSPQTADFSPVAG